MAPTLLMPDSVVLTLLYVRNAHRTVFILYTNSKKNYNELCLSNSFKSYQQGMNLASSKPLDYFKADPRYIICFPGGSDSKESACNAGVSGSIPGSGRSPGEGNGHPLQYSCLENSMDRGTWRATAHGIEKNQTLLSD